MQYKLYKVFKLLDLPKAIQDEFIETYEPRHDAYSIVSLKYGSDGESVKEWLLENGAEHGEVVLVDCSW